GFRCGRVGVIAALFSSRVRTGLSSARRDRSILRASAQGNDLMSLAAWRDPRSRKRPREAAMRIPTLRGVIDRRLLVNFRVDPDVLARHLPPPFMPKLIRGYGMVGICLIRLKNVRPRFAPS